MLKFRGPFFLKFFLLISETYTNAQNLVVKGPSTSCQLRLQVAAPVSNKSVGHLRDLDELRVGTFNVLNFYYSVGADPTVSTASGLLDEEQWGQSRQPTQKPTAHRLAIADIIKKSRMDFVVLQEIEGGLTTLENFSRDMLDNAYQAYLLPGNDDRQIDIGFLVRKDLPIQVELRTNKDEMWFDPTRKTEIKVFSRDLPELWIKDKDGKPLMIILGVHYKSKRDRSGDPESHLLREAQVQRTTQIIHRLQKQLGSDFPILLAGDFNGAVNVEEEFMWLTRYARMDDMYNLKKPSVSRLNRVTHSFFPQQGPVHYSQLDAILISRSLSAAIRDIEVLRYQDAQGQTLPLPQNMDQRNRLPSDHYPVLGILDPKKLFLSDIILPSSSP